MTIELTPDEVLMLAQGYSENFAQAMDNVRSAAEVENWEMWDEEMGNASFFAARSIDLHRTFRSMVESAEVEEGD